MGKEEKISLAIGLGYFAFWIILGPFIGHVLYSGFWIAIDAVHQANMTAVQDMLL